MDPIKNIEDKLDKYEKKASQKIRQNKKLKNEYYFQKLLFYILISGIIILTLVYLFS